MCPVFCLLTQQLHINQTSVCISQILEQTVDSEHKSSFAELSNINIEFGESLQLKFNKSYWSNVYFSKFIFLTS